MVHVVEVWRGIMGGSCMHKEVPILEGYGVGPGLCRNLDVDFREHYFWALR